MKKLDENACFFHSMVLAGLTFFLILCGLPSMPKEAVLIPAVVYAAQLSYNYNKLLHPQENEQQQYNNINNIRTTGTDNSVPFVTYDDICPDDEEDYGPEGSVIWGPRTIEENIYINGKWYINENSEEWEENEGC